jgi:protein TonB
MVPPEEIDKAQPTTLPADFGEWDSGEPAAAEPVTVNAYEGIPGSGGAPKAPQKIAAARVAVLPAAGRAPAASSRPPAAYAEVEQVYLPPQPRGAKAGVSRLEDESEGNKKKTGMFIGIGVLVVLLAGGSVAVLKMRTKTVEPNQSATSQMSQTVMTNLQKPTPATPTAGSTAMATQTVAPTTPTTDTDRPLRAQSDAMNKQLNAPSRISSDMRALTGKDAPPAADFGAEGLGGGANVFSGSGPKVKVEASKKVNISAGVAVGLLIQKTPPTYPPIAKQARVSGTVVIQAAISKNGSVGNLRVVSGPAMLRQAALDAVKTWRFRPYMLDGEPVEVDTTVNVTFALSQ